MNGRHGAFRSFTGTVLVLAGGASLAWGQAAAVPVPSHKSGDRVASSVRQSTVPAGTFGRPDWAVQRALGANPLTAPYPIVATWRDGVVVLQGRVGTKQIHDAAVQMAIAFGFPFRDDLVIDTAEALRVATRPPVMPLGGPGAYGGPATGAGRPNGPISGYYEYYGRGPGGAAPNASYYVYPEPLFGRLDDPFFGMVPPLLTFPPWWRPRSIERRMAGPGAGLAAPNAGPVGSEMGQASGSGAASSFAAPGTPVPGGASNGAADEFAPPPAKGDLQITVDANGQVFLRGVVASEEDARAIEEAARSVPGVGRVFTQLQVKPRRAEPDRDQPPPPPRPFKAPAGRDRDQAPGSPSDVDRSAPKSDAAKAKVVPEAETDHSGPGGAAPAILVAALDDHRLSQKAVVSLSKRPAVARLPIRVRSDDDVVVMTGEVPSAYEAMIAFRAVQRTPGVRQVVDRLEFLVPDENHANPLVEKARPEDLEPYLAAQVAHHLGDLAHVDDVRVHGDRMEIRGTILDPSDHDRVLAILRSVPVLHGFHLDATFLTD